jgi:hypothetical protein
VEVSNPKNNQKFSTREFFWNTWQFCLLLLKF